MSRPFTPRSALRLRRQQSQGTSLDLETEVLLGRSPLTEALTGMWPLGDGGVETLVLDPSEGNRSGGFVQARQRLEPSEADLVFIAPSLAGKHGAALAWQRMIGDACQWMGAKGVQRLFIAIDEGDQLAVQILRRLAFSVYTSDVVYRRADTERLAPPSDLCVRDEQDVDRHDLRRLYFADAPEKVRAAEDTGGGLPACPLGGRQAGPAVRRVWLDERGAVSGGWHLAAGRGGHWLSVVAGAATDPAPAIRRALADAPLEAGLRALPVFACARGHETGLNLALRETGFEPIRRRFRLVKHTTVRLVEPAWGRKPLPRGGLDPAPSRSTPLVRSALRRPSQGERPS